MEPAAVKSLRIAQLVPSLRGGGLERVVTDLAIALTRAGHECAVFVLNGLGVYQQPLETAGVRVIDCQEGRFRVRGYPRHLVSRLRQFKPDVVHAHSGTWLPGAVASTLLDLPLVFTDHGRYPPEPRSRALIQRWCARRTDRIVAVSAPLAAYVQDFLGLASNPSVIPNGIDLAPFRDRGDERGRLRAEWSIPADAVLAIAVGRFAPVKNHVGMVRALAAASRTSSRLHLALLGTGPLEPDIRAEARRLGVLERVRFLGFRSDVPACLAAADLWLLASSTEGLPIALLEAMAAGLPIVSTAVGGIPDALGDPPAGRLVPPGDDAALGEALAAAARDREWRTQVGASVSRRAKVFSLELMMGRYVELYRSLGD